MVTAIGLNSLRFAHAGRPEDLSWRRYAKPSNNASISNAQPMRARDAQGTQEGRNDVKIAAKGIANVFPDNLVPDRHEGGLRFMNRPAIGEISR
jgi:hypothetical protein